MSLERFILIQRNCDENDYPYRNIRGSNDYVERKLEFERCDFPNLIVLLDFSYDPNYENLYSKIHDILKTKVTDPFELRAIYNSIKMYNR
jgi:hypothetical protein